MNFRIAQAKDIKAISDLAAMLTRKYVVPEFSDQAADKLLASMSDQGISNCIKNDVVYHVAEDDDLIVGLIGIHANRHLYHLFVNENYQR